MGDRSVGFIIVCIFLAFFVVTCSVAAAPSLRLDFYKNNGYGMGEDMQGEWTINTVVSSNVTRVEFYLDGQLQKNATATPFSWSFNTADYNQSKHTFTVIAFDSTGATAESERQANFVGVPVSFVAAIIGIIVTITVVVLVVSVYRIKKADAKKNQI